MVDHSAIAERLSKFQIGRHLVDESAGHLTKENKTKLAHFLPNILGTIIDKSVPESPPAVFGPFFVVEAQMCDR